MVKTREGSRQTEVTSLASLRCMILELEAYETPVLGLRTRKSNLFALLESKFRQLSHLPSSLPGRRHQQLQVPDRRPSDPLQERHHRSTTRLLWGDTSKWYSC